MGLSGLRRWAWRFGHPEAQKRVERLWSPAEPILRQSFWKEMILRYRGMVRRGLEQKRPMPPVPEWVKAHIRKLLAQHPELLEAMMDVPIESIGGLEPFDLRLRLREYHENNPQLTAEEIVVRILAKHGRRWITEGTTAPAIIVTGLLHTIRRLIEEGEL